MATRMIDRNLPTEKHLQGFTATLFEKSRRRFVAVKAMQPCRGGNACFFCIGRTDCRLRAAWRPVFRVLMASLYVSLSGLANAQTEQSDQDARVLAERGAGDIFQRATFDVLVARGVPYGQGMIYHPTDSSRSYPRNLTLDIYQPDQKNPSKRPVVLLVHSGGFWTGDSLMKSMVRAGNYFATRGWVCFSINYRLHGDRAIAPKDWPANRPTYAATRDAKAAVRWIRAHADEYHLNGDAMVAYGASAGAYISVALASSDEADFRDELLTNDAEKKLLEETHLEQSSRIQAAVVHWGSGLLLDLLKRYDGRKRFDVDDAPLLVVHGTEDKLVPYHHAEDLVNQYRAPLQHFKLDGFGHSAWNAKVDGKSLLDAVYPFMQRSLGIQAK